MKVRVMASAPAADKRNGGLGLRETDPQLEELKKITGFSDEAD